MTDDTQGGGVQPTQPPAPSYQIEGDGTLVMPDGRKFVPIERYNGLQGPLSRKEQELRDIKAQLHDFTQQRETEVAGLKAELEAFQKGNSDFDAQIKELNEYKAQAEQQLKALNAQLETNKLFLSEKYQPLIPSLEKGVLRLDGLEGDALTQYLDNFLADRQALLENGQQQRQAGGSPPPPAGGATADQTPEQLLERVMSTPPTDPKYSELLQSYKDALKKQ